jgi:acyl carrier protein
LEKLYELLREMRPDVDFENEKALIDSGILDSFDVVNIASEIMETFNVEITAEHIKPEI